MYAFKAQSDVLDKFEDLHSRIIKQITEIHAENSSVVYGHFEAEYNKDTEVRSTYMYIYITLAIYTCMILLVILMMLLVYTVEPLNNVTFVGTSYSVHYREVPFFEDYRCAGTLEK